MAFPNIFKDKLSLPAISAPMFLASGPNLVIETCKAGIVGSFPSLNQREAEGFESWLIQIKNELAQFETETNIAPAPFAVNLIVNKMNPRLTEDLELCIKHEVPIIITSLGIDQELIEKVHNYGGLVFHDVVNAKYAKKAADSGVDGIIAVGAGAGGHAGSTSPFALMNEIGEFFDGTLILSGAMSTGSDIAAAIMMGADLAYLGTRFIGTQEAMVEEDYKNLLLESTARDIVYTPALSLSNANFIRQSIEAAGIDVKEMLKTGQANIDPELNKTPWRDIWSAGQGVGSIKDLPTIVELSGRLIEEFYQANQNFEKKISLLTTSK